MRVELCEDWLATDAEGQIWNQAVTGDKSWIKARCTRSLYSSI